MSELPRAGWFDDFRDFLACESSDDRDDFGLEPMAVPIHVIGNEWYTDGTGYTDNHNRLWVGDVPQAALDAPAPTAEISAWRKVASHLEAGGDIMDVVVPHEDGVRDGNPQTTAAIQENDVLVSPEWVQAAHQLINASQR